MSGSKSMQSGLTRRGFLKTTGAAAGVAVLGGGASGLSSLAAKNVAFAESEDKEAVVTTSCRSNCFQACMLKAHVRDGKVCYMSRGDYPEDIYSGCCPRGLSMHERAYSRTRIKYPMRRIAGRGDDQWERISWEEAIEEVVEKLKAVREEYGNRAVVFDTGSGNYGAVQGHTGVQLLFKNALETTSLAGCYDKAFGHGTNRVIGGGFWSYSNELTTVLDAKNVLIWGANPVNSQPQNWRILRYAKERGAKLTCIDVLFSATAARCDDFLPVQPGSDLVIALAILNDVVSSDAIDESYAKQYTSAPFLVRKDNGLILRRSDIEGGEMAAVRDAATLNKAGSMADDPAYVWDEGSSSAALYTACESPALEGEFEIGGIQVETVYSVLKKHVSEYTMEKASELSGVSVGAIEGLSRVYKEGDPVFLYTIYGIDHYRNGHLFAQAMTILHALTNNISRPGSSVGGYASLGDQMQPNNAAFVPASGKKSYEGMPHCDLAQTIRTGKHKGEDYPVKALLFASSNSISNWPEQNVWFDTILPHMDFVLTIDTEFTDTARYSDMVLPAAFWTEYNELRANGYANPFVLYAHKAMEPLYEAKPDSEILALIAKGLGLENDFPLCTPEEWIEIRVASKSFEARGITLQSLRENAAIRGVGSEDEPFLRGAKGTFPTPSGRAELYCELPLPRIDYGQDWNEASKRERLPYFMPPVEVWPESEAARKYPLAYIQIHERWRTHTQWFAVESLRELDPEPLLHLSREDAAARGIEDGDIAEAFNDRGSVTIKAIIDDAFPQGVCGIPKGWQRNQFIEGCYQDLTAAESDPMAVNFAFFDVRVDVRKK